MQRTRFNFPNWIRIQITKNICYSGFTIKIVFSVNWLFTFHEHITLFRPTLWTTLFGHRPNICPPVFIHFCFGRFPVSRKSHWKIGVYKGCNENVVWKMSDLLLSICIVLFVYDNLKWIQFSTILVICGISFVDPYILFCVCTSLWVHHLWYG